MARKSGFTQFAENFQSAYGMVNDFQKERTSRGIAGEKQTEEFDDAGNFVGWKYNDELTPEKRSDDTMRGLRTNRIADNLEYHGDRSGAADLRTSQATYQQTLNANQRFADTNAAEVAEANATSGLAAQEANLSMANNQVLADFSKLQKAGNFEAPGSAKTWLMAEFEKSGNPKIAAIIKGMDDNMLGQTLNSGIQLRAQAEKALIGGIASTRKMLDGINLDGKGTLIRNEDGSFTFDEFLEDGTSIPGAAIQGKDWTEFQANVRGRLDPMNSITIALNHDKIAMGEANKALVNAQTLEALQKASGNSEKMNGIKATAIAKFTTEVGGAYYQAKTDAEKKRVLDIFKYELDNFDKQRNKDGSYNQPKPAPASAPAPSALNNLNNTVDGAPVGGGGTPTSGISNKNSDTVPAPETKKVLTKANIAEIAALDNEVTDIKAKVVELSKVRGLQSGGKARNEIQKLRKRLVGIEQRKYKIQN